MSRSNLTRDLLREALEAALEYEGVLTSPDPCRNALAYLCGYIKSTEPEIARKLDKLLELGRQADERRFRA